MCFNSIVVTGIFLADVDDRWVNDFTFFTTRNHARHHRRKNRQSPSIPADDRSCRPYLTFRSCAAAPTKMQCPFLLALKCQSRKPIAITVVPSQCTRARPAGSPRYRTLVKYTGIVGPERSSSPVAV